MIRSPLISVAPWLCVLWAACSGSGSSDTKQQIDAGRTRRQLPPPTGTVRPLPPYAIDPGGIGPYRLGATPGEIYAVMPEAIPRIAILDIAQVLDVSVVRCEADQLLAGNKPDERVTFLAALTAGIAQTESGLAVGARRPALDTLGPAVVDPRIARDPKIFVPASNPSARFLIDDDRVAAIVVVGTGDPVAVPATPAPAAALDAAPADPGGSACSTALPAPEAELRAVAQVAQGPADVAAACLTPQGREAVVVAGDTITVIGTDNDKLRRLATTEVRGLRWAAPLRRDADRDDLVAVAEARTDDELVISLIALRLEGGRLTRIAEESAYRVTGTNAQWIGARLADLRLLIAVEDRADGYQLGGVLIHRGPAGARDVAPLNPVTIQRRRRQPGEPTASPPPVDAGPATDARPPRDAGVDAGP